jgi:hypothetical protein
MEIENTRKTLRINQMRYIAVIAFIVIVVILLTTDPFKGESLGFDKYLWAAVIALIYLMLNIYEYLRDYNYIYFSDAENKILFRYIPLSPFKSKRYSIEIHKNEFHAYKINRSSILKKELILFVKTPQGIAKYPPISISALNENEFNKLKKALNENLSRDLHQ